jgi:hypothetical protein
LFSSLFLDQTLAVNIDVGDTTTATYQSLVTTMCNLIKNSTDAATLLGRTQEYVLYIGTHETSSLLTSNVLASEVFTVVVGFKKSNTSC